MRERRKRRGKEGKGNEVRQNWFWQMDLTKIKWSEHTAD